MAKNRKDALSVEWIDEPAELDGELERALACAVVGVDCADSAPGSETRSLEFKLGLVPCVARAQFMARRSGRLSCTAQVGVVGSGLSTQSGGFDLSMNWVFTLDWAEIAGRAPDFAAHCFSASFVDACAKLAQAEHFKAQRLRRLSMHEAAELDEEAALAESSGSGSGRL